MPLRNDQIECLQEALHDGVSDEALMEQFSISQATIEKYKKFPADQIPSSKEWVAVRALAEQHHRDISHLLRIIGKRKIARIHFHGMSYISLKDAATLFLPDDLAARTIPLKKACELLGVDYPYILSEYASPGKITTYRAMKRHMVDLSEFRRELEAYGMQVGPVKADDPILLADAARLLGYDSSDLSKLAYAGKITVEKRGSRYVVHDIDLLRKELSA